MACLGLGGGSKKSNYNKDINIASEPFLEVTLSLPGQKAIVICDEAGNYLPTKKEGGNKKKKQQAKLPAGKFYSLLSI